LGEGESSIDAELMGWQLEGLTVRVLRLSLRLGVFFGGLHLWWFFDAQRLAC
jgi:hypothetical protein